MRRLGIVAVGLALVVGVVVGGLLANPFDGKASASATVGQAVPPVSEVAATNPDGHCVMLLSDSNIVRHPEKHPGWHVIGGECGAPTPTPTPTPTVTPGGHTVSGIVCEFPPPGMCGALRGATVTLEPLGWTTTTSLSDGSFAFFGVPDGGYTLTVSPQCTPFGCYEPTPVTVAGADTSVQIVPVPTPTPTP